MNERECVICDKVVYPMNEVDVGVCTAYSMETPICEDCYQNEPERVEEILAEAMDLERIVLIYFNQKEDV